MPSANGPKPSSCCEPPCSPFHRSALRNSRTRAYAEQVIRHECELALKQIAEPVNIDEIRANLESMRQTSADQEAQLRKITRRERRVLELVAGDHSNKEVAALMGITFKTVASHRTHLMKKLNIHDTASLTLRGRVRSDTGVTGTGSLIMGNPGATPRPRA